MKSFIKKIKETLGLYKPTLKEQLARIKYQPKQVKVKGIAFINHLERVL